MKIYAINGSPRKNKNTATLLKKALEGVKYSIKDEEVQTDIINLYDYNFTGCKSCFACKKIDGKSYGRCALRDDISEIIENVSKADGIIFGSPIFFQNITGELKSFLERLLFPYLTYDDKHTSLAPKKMPTAIIYTMNVTEDQMKKSGYVNTFNQIESYIQAIFSKPESMYSNNTYQFDDYSKYKSDVFSEEDKAKQRDIQFPLDCEKTFNIGENMAKNKRKVLLPTF